MNTNTTTHTRTDARSLFLAALAMACLAATSTIVHAADQSSDFEAMKKTVTYGDLNLANSQGVERLYWRIVAAAQQVCGSLDGRSLERKIQFSICTKQSIARAVAAVGQPALAALHAAKTGQATRTATLAKQ